MTSHATDLVLTAISAVLSMAAFFAVRHEEGKPEPIQVTKVKPMPTERKIKPSRRAFTLVELLVVMVCIVVLMSIILPAVQSAREAARRTSCQSNLRQLGIAMLNHEAALGMFPAAGKSIDMKTSPPSFVYQDGGWSGIAKLLPYLEQGTLMGKADLTAPYNADDGRNFTYASTSLNVLMCPSSNRKTAKDTAQLDPNASAFEKSQTEGYGYCDFALSIGTDIAAVGGAGATAIAPNKDTSKTALGLFHSRGTKISECSDGTSTTLAILECAGRDERQVSPNNEIPGAAGAPNAPQRWWRWASVDGGILTSTQPNNPGTPMNEGTAWPTTTATSGNMAGDNGSPFAFHSGGVNVLYADGHLGVLKSTTPPAVLRALITPDGGEVVSQDQY